MELHIVRIESIRHFDEFERSYLPYMNEIFGVFKSKKEATEAVGRYFGSDEYEWIFNNDECPYCDELFKYVDKEYGGVAYYGIFYHTEYLTE